MQLWTCQPEWQGQSCFILAGGSSARELDLRLLKGRKVIVINSSVFSYPDADFLYFTDSHWWYHYHVFNEIKAFKGRIVTTSPARMPDHVLKMQKVKPDCGLTLNRNSLAVQYNSVTASLNLAYHLGAVRIGLIGADNCPGEDGVMYHHRPHPPNWNYKPGHFDLQRDELAKTRKPLKRAGIELANISPISRLDFWPTKTLEECLAWP